LFVKLPSLILKRANASRSSGKWKDEDYDVLADGKVVGRILEEGPRELLWVWSITAIVPASPATHGHARTLRKPKPNFATAGPRPLPQYLQTGRKIKTWDRDGIRRDVPQAV
jgi:hypothetical protein